MIKGVTEEENRIIKNILDNYKLEIFAYGSRVKGDFTALSDLDLLICNNISKNLLNEIKEKFDKSKLPYIVNITEFETIDKDFYSLIKKDLTKL